MTEDSKDLESSAGIDSDTMAGSNTVTNSLELSNRILFAKATSSARESPSLMTSNLNKRLNKTMSVPDLENHRVKAE